MPSLVCESGAGESAHGQAESMHLYPEKLSHPLALVVAGWKALASGMHALGVYVRTAVEAK